MFVSNSDATIMNKQLQKIVGHHLNFNTSYKAMESMAGIVNSTPNASVKVPATKYMIKKSIPQQFENESHIKCRRCSNFIRSLQNETRCELCDLMIKTANSEYFVYIHIKTQLEHAIKCNINEILSNYAKERQPEYIKDIFDSRIFMQIKEKYSGYIILPLIVNTDGAKVFNNNQKSLWMIQCVQGWLPPSIRFCPSNVLIIAAHFGAKKPNMNDFFFPFLKDSREINDTGGIKITHNGSTLNFMPILFSCCCDLPAKADVQGMCGHSGYFACNFCLHPGILVPGEKKDVIRYIKGSNNYELRSHKNTIETYGRLRTMPIQGVKRLSCMVAAKEFDIIFGFSIDYMHCVLLGVMKKLLNLWLDTKNHKKNYYIEKKNQIALNKRLMNIKPISEIIRKPRSILSRGDYKANEYRSLLYYYLWFALDGLLHAKYVKHFRLLSCAIYSLSKDAISLEDIEEARSQLINFTDDFEVLYGKSNVTINLHLIRHIPMQIQNLGPLWSQSAFAFEANNGIVIKSNSSTKDIAHQLMWKYSMKQKMKTSSDTEKRDDCSFGGKSVILITSDELNLFQQNGLNIEINTFLRIYKKVVVHGIKYTSLQSKEVSTIDFFVRMKGNNQIGAVKYYTIINSTLYALVNTYHIIDSFGHFFQIEQNDAEQNLVQMNDISEKMLYMKFGLREFIVSIPNRYEKT